MVQFGIWIFDRKTGLVGRPHNLPELYLTTSKIWDVKETEKGLVWKWPVHLIDFYWFSPAVADDFNKAFFYAQQYFEAFRPRELAEKLDLDSRTTRVQAERLNYNFPGSDDELIKRK